MAKNIGKGILILVVTLLAFFEVLFMWLPFSVDFTDKVYLKFHYGETEMDCEITDKDDIRALKSLFRTFSYCDVLAGTPSCGFDPGVSLTFQRNNKKVMICPGGDTCGNFQIGESHRFFFVSEKGKEKFYKIVKKYGMTFPCV